MTSEQLDFTAKAPTVARLASIPHGTTILAQGTAGTTAAAPGIPAGLLPKTPVAGPA